MTDTAFLQQLLNLPEHGGIQRFLRNVQRTHIKKGTVLVEPGQVQAQLIILVSGVFRGFLLDAEGRDITDCFAFRAGEILMGCNDLTEPSRSTWRRLQTAMSCSSPWRMFWRLWRRFRS